MPRGPHQDRFQLARGARSADGPERRITSVAAGWTRRVRGTDDLGTLLMRALAVQPATDATASATRYGGAEIRASEQQREQERQQRLAELRQRFVEGPVLLIPGGGGGMSDSRGAVVIPGVGTVYFGRGLGRSIYRAMGGGRVR